MMSKLLRPPIKLASAITLALVMLISNSASVRAENSRRNSSSEPPPAPDTGTPKGEATPGTTRPQATCPHMSKPLTALVANNGRDYTLSEHPSFWFYVPYAPNQISYMEFLLLDGKERRTIYRTAVKLTQKPGLIKVTIPSGLQYSFKLNETYRWYFKVNCQVGRTDESDLVVDGWVRRQPRKFQMKNRIKVVQPSYKENDFWYDTITNLAQQHFSHPENRQFNQDWANLLEYLGYPWVVQEPFANSVLLPPAD